MPTTLKEFESVWPRIRADLQEHCKQYKLPQQSLDWFTKVHTQKTPTGSTAARSFLATVSRLQHRRWKM